jgi:hypothetical protein
VHRELGLLRLLAAIACSATQLHSLRADRFARQRPRWLFVERALDWVERQHEALVALLLSGCDALPRLNPNPAAQAEAVAPAPAARSTMRGTGWTGATSSATATPSLTATSLGCSRTPWPTGMMSRGG